MGLVCGRQQLEDIVQHIETEKSQGARLLIGGDQAVDNNLDVGCFVQPTQFDAVETGMSISQEKVFGPLLAIMRTNNYEEGLQLANEIP